MENETYKFDPRDIQENKGLACISYLGILFIIPMLVNKNSPFIKFHVNQGIVLLILDVILSFAARIVRTILYHIPFVSWFAWTIPTLVGILAFALAIYGLINAAQGQAKRLPVIGNIEIYR